jgi:alpha-galactosidase
MKLYILLLLAIYTLALDNGLAKTPPMGWNSWNRFHCNINETLIKQTVDLLVSTGLAAKGYKYVNLDDCWQIERNKTTN